VQSTLPILGVGGFHLPSLITFRFRIVLLTVSTVSETLPSDGSMDLLLIGNLLLDQRLPVTLTSS